MGKDMTNTRVKADDRERDESTREDIIAKWSEDEG